MDRKPNKQMINIDSVLPVHEYFKNSYEEKAETGKQYLKDKNITVISLVRNLEDVLHKNFSIVTNFLKEHCKQYSYIIFENDSKDNTKNILANLQKDYNTLHVISENFNRQHYGPVKSSDRVKALAEYRNSAKKYAQENTQSDFVIVLDLDFASISLNGLLNSFGWLSAMPSLSAVAGNSFTYKIRPDSTTDYYIWNYDSWAFRHTWWYDLQFNNPAPTVKYDPMLWFGLWILPNGSPPFNVNSAFGGCGIYRSKNYFCGANYDHLDCEHVCFHYNLQQQNSEFSLVVNPSQIMLFDK